MLCSKKHLHLPTLVPTQDQRPQRHSIASLKPGCQMGGWVLALSVLPAFFFGLETLPGLQKGRSKIKGGQRTEVSNPKLSRVRGFPRFCKWIAGCWINDPKTSELSNLLSPGKPSIQQRKPCKQASTDYQVAWSISLSDSNGRHDSN